jgi:hypothetical protein
MDGPLKFDAIMVLYHLNYYVPDLLCFTESLQLDISYSLCASE